MGPLRRGEAQRIDVPGPAIGLVEVQSIARGITVADAMVKRAEVALLLNRPVSPGKHLSLCSGEVAEVEEALRAGLAQAGTTLCDHLLLPQVHAEVIAAFRRSAPLVLSENQSLGILETYSAAATIVGADGACKAAEVAIAELRLCDGLGGKGFAVFIGEQDMVEAALLDAERLLSPGLFLGRELIPRPHPDMLRTLLPGA
jgi:microcompartment protein CcmL/EutN